MLNKFIHCWAASVVGCHLITAASPLLSKKLLGQLEGVGQESCPLPGSFFPPPMELELALLLQQLKLFPEALDLHCCVAQSICWWCRLGRLGSKPLSCDAHYEGGHRWQMSCSAGELLAAGVGDIRRLWALWVASRLLLHLTRSDFCALWHRWLCQAFHPALMYRYAPLILAGLSTNALYCHCRYSLSWVVILGSILMGCSTFPPLGHTWGYLSFVGFLASFGVFLSSEMIWAPNCLYPGCHLSGHPLSL